MHKSRKYNKKFPVRFHLFFDENLLLSNLSIYFDLICYFETTCINMKFLFCAKLMNLKNYLVFSELMLSFRLY